MRIAKKLNIALCAAVLIACAMPAAAQQAGSTGNYPNRALRMVMPFPPGGPTDILGRLLAQRLGEALGQNVLVDNRAGGGGAIGGQVAAKSPPDGYTLTMSAANAISTAMNAIQYTLVVPNTMVAAPKMATTHNNVRPT